MLTPIDHIENVVSGQDWHYRRVSSDEMVVEISGRWCEYRLHFFWQSDIEILHINNYLDLSIESCESNDIYVLITLINQRLALGHFEISHQDKYIYYRYALLMVSEPTLKQEYIEDLIEVIASECERFYSAFQMLLFGQKTPEEAISIALLETIGEA